MIILSGNIEDMTKEAAMVLIEKIFQLRKIRDNFITEKQSKITDLKKEIKEVTKRNHDEMKKVELKCIKDVKGVEKDIYNFENSIKKITGSKKYYEYMMKYKKDKEIEARKAETLKTEEPNNEKETSIPVE